MPKYKLTYFDLEARGELIRLIFAAAKVEYEDHRISLDEWPKFKSSYNLLNMFTHKSFISLKILIKQNKKIVFFSIKV